MRICCLLYTVYLLLTQPWGCSEFVVTSGVWKMHCEMSFYGRWVSTSYYESQHANSVFCQPVAVGTEENQLSWANNYTALEGRYQRTKNWGQPRSCAGEAGAAVAAYQPGWFFGCGSLYLTFTDFRPFSRFGSHPVCSLLWVFWYPFTHLSANFAWISFCCFQPRTLTQRDPFCRCGDGQLVIFWTYFKKRLDRICWIWNVRERNQGWRPNFWSE